MVSLSRWFFRLAVLYFVVGVLLGIGMGATQNFSLKPVHVHVNLLGWVSMTLFGLFYRAIPLAAASRLARAHFWVYVLALPVQMVLLALLYLGRKEVEAPLGIASIAVGLAVLSFAVVVWRSTGALAESKAG